MQIENPCIYSSDDGISCAAPVGVTNPVEPGPGGSAYNSDRHLLEGADRRLYCFWRRYDPNATGAEEKFYYRASSNGVDWSDNPLAIPTRSQHDGWYRPQSSTRVAPGTFGCGHRPRPQHHRAHDRLGFHWAVVRARDLHRHNLQAGQERWHLNVHRIGSEYVLLYMDVTLNGSDGDVLYRAVSRDGVAFTQDAGPFLGPVKGRWDALLYRFCLLPSTIKGKGGMKSGTRRQRRPTRFGRTTAIITDVRPRQDDKQNLMAAMYVFSGYLLGDVINRVDSATVPGAASSGQAWTVDAGTISVQGKAFYRPTATNSRMTIDIGAADVEVGCPLKALDRVGQDWFVVRFMDASNFIRAGLKSGVWTIEAVVAGAATALAAYTGASIAPENGQRMRVVAPRAAPSASILTAGWWPPASAWRGRPRQRSASTPTRRRFVSAPFTRRQPSADILSHLFSVMLSALGE